MNAPARLQYFEVAQLLSKYKEYKASCVQQRGNNRVANVAYLVGASSWINKELHMYICERYNGIRAHHQLEILQLMIEKPWIEMVEAVLNDSET